MSLRIASLVPAATEIVAALGAVGDLVGVSHACDYPAEVTSLPRLTRSHVCATESDAEIDRGVRELTDAGEDLYDVDVETLRRLDARVVLAQELCDICAVSPDRLRVALEAADSSARVVVLRADSLVGVARDVIEVADAIDRPEEGRLLADALERRLDELHALTAGRPRIRVASLEWLDPPFAAGHWVPQMVRIAGGEEVLGKDGERSRRVEWSTVEAAVPDVLCVLPCGQDVDRAYRSWRAAHTRLIALGSRLAELPVLLLDGNGLFSRPGPRLGRGVAVLAALLHPELGLPVPARDEGAAA